MSSVAEGFLHCVLIIAAGIGLGSAVSYVCPKPAVIADCGCKDDCKCNPCHCAKHKIEKGQCKLQPTVETVAPKCCNPDCCHKE
jgi:hypothetical protein